MILKEYLHVTGITQLAFSETVNCSAGRLCQIVGGRNPGFHLAMRIEKATGGRVSLKDMVEGVNHDRAEN